MYQYVIEECYNVPTVEILFQCHKQLNIENFVIKNKKINKKKAIKNKKVPA